MDLETSEVETPVPSTEIPSDNSTSNETDPPAIASESTETPAGESQSTETTKQPESPPSPPREDWREKRIAKLTAQLREAQARIAESSPQNTSPQIDFENRVREEAARLARAEKFNADCQTVVNQGRKDFTDFDSRVENLKRIADSSDESSIAAYSTLISAAIETGEGAKIIHQLGGNLDEAARLMGLSPVRMGVELAKMAFREPEQISSAPKPIRNLGGAAQHTAIDPTDPSRASRLSTAEWMRRREEQISSRRQSGRR